MSSNFINFKKLFLHIVNVFTSIYAPLIVLVHKRFQILPITLTKMNPYYKCISYASFKFFNKDEETPDITLHLKFLMGLCK